MQLCIILTFHFYLNGFTENVYGIKHLYRLDILTNNFHYFFHSFLLLSNFFKTYSLTDYLNCLISIFPVLVLSLITGCFFIHLINSTASNSKERQIRYLVIYIKVPTSNQTKFILYLSRYSHGIL